MNHSLVQKREFKVATTRDAFAVLCIQVYGRFGQEALPLIRDVCYKLGAAAGERMKKDLPATDFKTLAAATVQSGTQTKGRIEAIEVSENRMHIREYTCELGLTNTSLDLCRAMMEIDRARIEAITGKKIRFQIPKSLAAGDEYCDVICTSEVS